MQNNKKTVFIITQFYPPDYAPTGQLIQELINSLDHKENHIQIFTGQPSYAYTKPLSAKFEEVDGVYIRRSNSTKLWGNRIRGKSISGILFCLRVLIYGIRNLDKDDSLILTTAPPFLSIVGYIFNYLRGVSYFCIIYDLYPDVAVKLGAISKNNLLVKIWDFLNQKIWDNSKKIIVLSNSMKRQVLTKHPKLTDKISVIHNWADPNWIKVIDKSENWFAQKYQLVDKFTVLYSGNMGRCHDMETIMQAVYRLKEELIQFVFIGGGVGSQYCSNLAKKWNLKNCLFLPYQDKKNIPYSLTACDLSLVSIKDGFEGVIAPSKFYSALASGRPIAAICQKSSYLSQIIEQSRCGEVFENGDSDGLSEFIQKLSTNPELAKSMGQSGRAHLEQNYTPEIIAQQYSRVLELEA
jgi:glycosyltransferase involved in cell wall biosynthesis